MSLRQSIGYLMPMFPPELVASSVYEVYFTLAFAGAITRFRRRVGGMNIGWDVTGYIKTAELVRQLESGDGTPKTIRFAEGAYTETFIGAVVNDTTQEMKPPGGTVTLTCDEVSRLLAEIHSYLEGKRLLYRGQIGPEVGIDSVSVKRVRFAGGPIPFSGWRSTYHEFDRGTIRAFPKGTDQITLVACAQRSFCAPCASREGGVIPVTTIREESREGRLEILLLPEQEVANASLARLAREVEMDIGELQRVWREYRDLERHMCVVSPDGSARSVTIVRPGIDDQEITFIDERGRHPFNMMPFFAALESAVTTECVMEDGGLNASVGSLRMLSTLFWGNEY